MYIVTVQIKVHHEHAAPFRTEMLKQAANSLAKEAACRQFDVSFDPENVASCFLYEKYDNRAAFEAHLQSDHFKQFDTKVSAWTQSKTVQTWNLVTTSENSL